MLLSVVTCLILAESAYLRKKLSCFHCGRLFSLATLISSALTISSYFAAAGEIDWLIHVVGRSVIALGQPVLEELLPRANPVRGRRS